MGALDGLWAFWRPVVEGKVTLGEAQTQWSIDDIADMNDAMDIRDEAEALAYEKAKQGRD